MESLKQISQTLKIPEPTGQEIMSDSTKSQISLCPDCKDLGWKYVPAGKGVAVARCGCIQKRIVEKYVPKKYQAAKVEDFRPEVSAGARRWMASPTGGMLLFGPAGTGKTHLAFGVFIELISKRLPAKFSRAADFFQAIRSSYSEGGPGEIEVMQEYLQAPMLILDDLGAGNLSAHQRQYTHELIDQRLNSGSPTVITTNWSLAEIAEKMDERIASRLQEYHLIEFNGKDRREA